MTDARGQCPKCKAELHACQQCAHFAPGQRFECTQPITARISPKDVVNDCQFYTARTTWERETSSAATNNPTEPSGARKAFDDLFKF